MTVAGTILPSLRWLYRTGRPPTSTPRQLPHKTLAHRWLTSSTSRWRLFPDRTSTGVLRRRIPDVTSRGRCQPRGGRNLSKQYRSSYLNTSDVGVAAASVRDAIWFLVRVGRLRVPRETRACILRLFSVPVWRRAVGYRALPCHSNYYLAEDAA